MNEECGYMAGFPLSIANVLGTEEKLKSFFESMVERLVKLSIEKKDDADWISPIVYSKQGRAFNVDYNFLVHCLGWHTDDETIESDFRIHNLMTSVVEKYATFLVVGILEEYYEIVKINNRSIDPSRYKTARKINLPVKYSNKVCIRNREKIVLFNAIPINEIKLKKMIGDELFSELFAISEKPYYEQVAFGDGQYYEFLKARGVEEIDTVF